MLALINSDDRRVNYALTAFAGLLLVGCLAYNVYLIWATPNSGLTFNARWEILDIQDCNDDIEACSNSDALRRHDRLMRVGGTSFQDFISNPRTIPFEGYLPGDLVPLTVMRDGQTFEVEWQMRAVDTATILRSSIVSLLVYGSFWLAGSFVLRHMRPADLTWVLLVGLFYLITIWLAVGLNTQSNVASSALLLRVVGWLMAAVLIHLHAVVPASHLDPRLKAPVALLYAAALLLLLLQLVGLLPWFAYLGGILLAALVSICLLTYRVLTPRAPTEKVTARLMLAGIVLAFVPGLILSAIPILLNIDASNAIGEALSVLALPMLPLFYTYAIYKHRLGVRERKVNRLLVQYALVLIYFIMLTLVFVFVSNWVWNDNTLLSIFTLIGLSLIVAFLPIRGPVQTVFDRLTYGTRYSRREILADFSDRILAAVDMQDLIHLLKYELAPEMEIRQSALLVRHGEEVSPLYWHGVAQDDIPDSWADTKAMSDGPERLAAGDEKRPSNVDQHWPWIRLALPLRIKDRLNGAWLFGRRETDGIYSQEDIDLLERLAGMVAVTLESGQLLDVLAHELETRRQAEAKLAEQSLRLSLIHEIDRAILAAGSPAEIARATFAGLRQMVPCVRISVFLFGADNDTMTIIAAEGSGRTIVSDNDSFPVPESPALSKLTRGQTAVIEDAEQIAPLSPLARSLVPEGVRTIISAPLMASGSVIGALNVAHSQPGVYAAAHVAMVEEVAASVALAIHNARLKETVDRNSEKLRILSTRLIDAQETERKRLSHELHDEMGQILTAVSLNLAAIERNLPETADESLQEQLADANSLVLGLTDQVRSLSLELRPSMLHDLGLAATLRWYVANYAKRQVAEIGFDSDSLPEHLPENVEITAYRVVQEALTNVSRHSRATHVDLTIAGIEDCIIVVVEDNGQGFDLESVTNNKSTSSGIGLAMMRERVAALNGRLAVCSEVGKGTRISAEIPIKGLP